MQQQGMDLQQALTELELLRQDNAALLEAVSQQQLSAHLRAVVSPAAKSPALTLPASCRGVSSLPVLLYVCAVAAGTAGWRRPAGPPVKIQP